MEEAERCDDLLLLRDGKLVAHGSPADLHQQTHTPSVEAAFLEGRGEFMSLIKTLATTQRVLLQLRHDHRTVGLILLVPCLATVVVKVYFYRPGAGLSAICPGLAGHFPFVDDVPGYLYRDPARADHRYP